METIAKLTARHFSDGTVCWIGVRPSRRQPVEAIQSVLLSETGIAGDHHSSGGKRSVTLLQEEHIPVISSLLGGRSIDPAMLRRNLVVSGISLLALRSRRFAIGSSVLEGTGLCAPCSRMEEILGHGGYNAVRGHGGITATVVTGGQISLGDKVSPV